MKRSRIVVVALFGMGVSVVSVLACNDRVSDVSGVVHPSSSAARAQGAASARADAGDEARRRFHAINRHDWVGLAHNRAIDEFRAGLRRGEISHDLCNDLVEFASAAERLPAEARATTGSRVQRRKLARRGLEMGQCAGRIVGVTGAIPLQLVQTADVAPETRAMLDQVTSAAAVSASSGELAAALIPIVEASAQLPGGESAIVQAAASVAQSSTEYWEANLDATKHDYDVAYGACMGQYGSLEEGTSACLGISGGGPAPTINRGTRARGLWLTQGATINCNRLRAREVVDNDVTGGIAGGIAGFWLGTAGGPAAPATASAGALGGALLGAASNSIGTFAWRWAQTTWCVLGGGGGPGTENPT
jgi:hypothetical protein